MRRRLVLLPPCSARIGTCPSAFINRPLWQELGLSTSYGHHVGFKPLHSRAFASKGKPAAKEKPSGSIQVAFPPRQKEVLAKKINNLLRHRTPVTASQYVGFLRKVGDQRGPSVLSDKVVSLVPQLTFENEATKVKARAEQDRKAKEAASTQKGAPGKQSTKETPKPVGDADEEKRKFTMILSSLAKMKRIESMLYVYNMLKSKERQEQEALAESSKGDTNNEAKWRVDAYIYNVVLDTLAKAGYMGKFEEVLREMESQRVEKDKVTYSILLNAYSVHGDEAKADQLLNQLKDQGITLDLAGYNGLMNIFARKKNIDRVLSTFQEMQTLGVNPDEGTFSILLECCAQDALDFRAETQPESGNEQVQKEIQRGLKNKRRRMEGVMRAMKKANVELDNVLINSIIRCYASIGEIDEMFDVVRFLKEEENIKLTEDNYSLMLYSAGREKTITLDRVRHVLNEMRNENVQPTDKTINATLNAFAFAGADSLEQFIFSTDQPQTTDGETERDPLSRPSESVKGSSVTLWQVMKQYGVPITDDILFNLLKLCATTEATEPQQPNTATADQESVMTTRKLDRFKLAQVLRKMQAEGLGPTSPIVINSLMRFHSSYGESRIKEVHALYNEMKRRKVKPNLQTYNIIAETILNAERRLTNQPPTHTASPQEKESSKERSELSYLLFSEMQSEGVQPDLKLFSNLITLYGYDERRNRRISGAEGDAKTNAEEEFKQKIFAILGEMRQAGLKPNAKILKSISTACSVAGADSLVRPLLEELPRIFPS